MGEIEMAIVVDVVLLPACASSVFFFFLITEKCLGFIKRCNESFYIKSSFYTQKLPDRTSFSNFPNGLDNFALPTSFFFLDHRLCDNHSSSSSSTGSPFPCV